MFELECCPDNFVDLVVQQPGCHHSAGSHNLCRQILSKPGCFPGSSPHLAGHCKNYSGMERAGCSPVVSSRCPSMLERRTMMPDFDHMFS